MKYGSVAGVDKKVSRICQGSIMFTEEKLDEAFALMDAAYEIGINCIDSAWIYGGGDCERCVGKDPYLLEVDCILRAFDEARAGREDLRLRILLARAATRPTSRFSRPFPRTWA